MIEIMKDDIRTLADELRKSIASPMVTAKEKSKPAERKPGKKEAVGKDTAGIESLIELIQNFDCSANKQMLHPRLDAKTIALLNGFKLATGIDMNKVISFSIDYLFGTNPELKIYIRNTLNNLEL